MGTLKSEFQRIQDQMNRKQATPVEIKKTIRLEEKPVERIRGMGVHTNDLLGPNTVLVRTSYNLDALKLVGKTEAYRLKESILRDKLIIVIAAINGTGYIHAMIDHEKCWLEDDGSVCIKFKDAKVVRPVGGLRFDSTKRVQV